ncbi:MAG: transcriptional regulator [Betaproteobacteria bacterium]
MSRIKNSPREIRRRLNLNQIDFWSKLGISQSGGSRYENGRRMPRSVSELMRLVYVEKLDLQNISCMDIEVINYLKIENSALFNELKRTAKEKSMTAARKLA